MLRSPVLKKVSTFAATAYLALFIGATQTFAAEIPNIAPTGNPGSVKPFDIGQFFTNGIQTAVNLIFFIAGAAAIIYLIWAGIKYITSGGDATKAATARSAIINAVIGIAVIIGAYTLINIASGLNEAVIDVNDGAQDFNTN